MKIKNFYDLSYEYNFMLCCYRSLLSDFSSDYLLKKNHKLYYQYDSIDAKKHYLMPYTTLVDEKDENIIHD